jgi:hypothetical protein
MLAWVCRAVCPRLFRLINTRNRALRVPHLAHNSFADPSSNIINLWRKPAKDSSLGKTISEVYHFSYSSIMQRQVAL